MPIACLITPQQLAPRLLQPKLVVLDCRFALEDPAYGQHGYDTGHIPGAYFADLEKDLSAPVQPGRTGRHPLPDPTHLLARLRTWGIDDDCDVVLYDDGPGTFAARAWWLLAWLGKREGVCLLDGGLKAWREADLPLTTTLPKPYQGNLHGEPDPTVVIDATGLQQHLDSAELTLLDARALPRFRGEVEPIDPVAGHIPGASCAPFTENLGPDGRFLPQEQLRQRFSALLANRAPEKLVAYCGSGVTACHNLFAFCLAGYPLPRLYAGSWSEWITDPTRPVATTG
ncbi:sulfurtransferase [Azomonas macrocytogenes]|uniref:Thiosulfate/3-mercaptopyruvate sulfurtransferase n=1 Tax=Azomonas macrocytogenes TaxID=69962 RepID=A0A839TAA2_AZOMA|nr:sulfurtransferase [Azomonas macrocytogenes]MBB3104975.1 thiosulfate/3-mercaptopyruvate sulfurtransferase [Azomonas macrocytogenes]